MVKLGAETDEFRRLVERFARLLAFNPRKLKVFVNALRLNMIVAFERGLFEPSNDANQVISAEQLAFFTAIVTNWPQITGDLARNPELFHDLIILGNDLPEGTVLKYWSKQPVLMEYLLERNPDMSELDIQPLLEISPRLHRVARDDDPSPAFAARNAQTENPAGRGPAQSSPVPTEADQTSYQPEEDDAQSFPVNTASKPEILRRPIMKPSLKT